ncbi:MAG: GNAT family N-acetyltransferase [Gammaproteobacteria bacterium]|nr:GNAT family N-acetyltransferase [Gammaproteobacteria bacterium]
MRGMIVTRRATVGDVPGMQGVRHAVWENRLVNSIISDDEVIEAIEESGRGWVAIDEHTVVGFVIAKQEDASIWALFVDPHHEGLGIGSGLLDRAVEWLFASGHDHITLSTDPGTRAERFYRERGWRKIGARDNGEVVLRLSRSARLDEGSTETVHDSN